MASKNSSSEPNAKLVRTLIENNISLQKKNIELIGSMHSLARKVENLLSIFEEASKHVMEVGEDKRILELTEKLEKLLEQNKTIAGGLLMLERYVREKAMPPSSGFGKPLR